MKRLSILIAALVMFAGVATAEDTITANFRASSVRIDVIDTTVDEQQLSGCWIRIYSFNDFGYYRYAFGFFFDGIEDIEDDTTYTLADMNGKLSYGVDYDYYEYAKYTSVSLTRINGVYTGTINTRINSKIDRTCILNQVMPIASGFKDTVHITSTDRVEGRLSCYGRTVKLVCADNNYKMNLPFFGTSALGAFSDDDINYVEDAILYDLTANHNIPLNNLLGNVTIAEDENGADTATVYWVGADSVLYIIDYSYSDPVALTQKTVSGELVVYANAPSGSDDGYDFDFDINGTEYTVIGQIFNSPEYSIDGTWDLTNGNFRIFFRNNETNVTYRGFSGSVTIANNIVTGTILAYGDIEFTINGTETAVESVEAPEYKTYTEGRTIVLNGAEGQNAALYDIAGRLISNGIVTSDNARFNVAASGIYLLRVNGQTLRIVVR